MFKISSNSCHPSETLDLVELRCHIDCPFPFNGIGSVVLRWRKTQMWIGTYGAPKATSVFAEEVNKVENDMIRYFSNLENIIICILFRFETALL